MLVPSLITFPARPVNGGKLEDAPPKIGPWITQPKIDDWRAVIHVPTKTVWNRHGELMTSDVTDKLVTALTILNGHPFQWLDVGVMQRRHKMMQGSIVVFDWIVPELTQQQRRDVLFNEFDELRLATNRLAGGPVRDRVFLIDEFVSTSPLQIYQVFQGENIALCQKFYEGVVCKRTDKPYPIQLLSAGKETPHMMKHRFDQ